MQRVNYRGYITDLTTSYFKKYLEKLTLYEIKYVYRVLFRVKIVRI